MSTSLRLVRSATLAASVISMLAAAPAGAQRRAARAGVAVPPRPQSTIPRIPASPPIATVPFGVVDSRVIDPRIRSRVNGNRRLNQRAHRRFNNDVPVIVGSGFGCCDGFYGGYPSVYDANGTPLTASFGPGEEQVPPPSVTYSGYNPPTYNGYTASGYTPNLTGSPYVITDEGLMAVDFASGVRRAFPSCAAQGDLRDPKGRPRTIFYRQTDYWMILKPGQQGRVQGNEPPANAKACYVIDSMGNVVLRQ
jgi:hypothetical protein